MPPFSIIMLCPAWAITVAYTTRRMCVFGESVIVTAGPLRQPAKYSSILGSQPSSVSIRGGGTDKQIFCLTAKHPFKRLLNVQDICAAIGSFTSFVLTQGLVEMHAWNCGMWLHKCVKVCRRVLTDNVPKSSDMCVNMSYINLAMAFVFMHRETNGDIESYIHRCRRV